MTSAFLHPFAPPAKETFRTIVGGEGAEVWDSDGRRYVDALASLWFCNIGHGRARMAEVMADQARTLAAFHTFDPFTNQPAEDLAARIVGLHPAARAKVFLASSGSEAVDTAMKLARRTHQLRGDHDRTIIVSRDRGYHGTNFGGTSAQGLPLNREGWGPLVPDVIQVPATNPEAMAQVFDAHGDRIAAVLTEPVPGAGGVFLPDPGYLDGLRRLCDASGALLIFDEVITGFGRTGSWFASQTYGVIPDLTTFAKAVTSGYVPLSGVVVGEAVLDTLEAEEAMLRHGYTYSGHPVAARAGLEAIAITEEEDLIGRVAHLAARFSEALGALADDGLVTDVRGVGAVWAVTVAEGRDAPAIRDGLLDRGVIVRPIFDHIAMCPPLVITDDQLDRLFDALAAELRA